MMNYVIFVQYLTPERAASVKDNIEWYFKEDANSTVIEVMRRGNVLRIKTTNLTYVKFIASTWCFLDSVQKFSYKHIGK